MLPTIVNLASVVTICRVIADTWFSDYFRLVRNFFNEKFIINRYFYAESEYNNIFLDKLIVQKVFNFKVIFSLLNTEETQI